MENKSLFATLESSPKFTLTSPATESLLHIETTGVPWPDEIRNNRKLQERARTRRLLSKELDNLYKLIPEATVDIWDSLKNGTIQEKNIVEFYDILSLLLEQDINNSQLVLYLPFEFLPDLNKQTETNELSSASTRLADQIRRSWRNLLTVHNLRADFKDGDVPEVEYRDEPLSQVVKAAHLIPSLLKRGLLSFDEILELLEKTTDKILADSIADTLPVLADMELITENDLDRMAKSGHRMISNMAAIIQASKRNSTEKDLNTSPATDISNITAMMQKDLENATLKIDKKFPETKNRRSLWLKEEERRIILEKFAGIVARHTLYHGTEQLEVLIKNKLSSSEKNIKTLLIIKSIQEIIETLAKTSADEAKEFYGKYEDEIKNLWLNEKDPETRTAIEELILHLYSLQIINDRQLTGFKIKSPTLNFGLTGRMDSLETHTRDITATIESIEKDEELSELIYPVVIMLGSRIKGYAKSKADLDIAVFVKPNTPFEKRKHLQDLIKKTFTHEKIQGEVMEFWLEENDGNMSILDFDNPDTKLGDSTLTHPLIGAWYGDTETIKELYKKLMPEYLYSEDKDILGQNAQKVWTEEIGRDTLQYRLMHKGYKHFFPKKGGIETTHSDNIDNDSAFYDSGYRRLATQLFVNRVFLPQLSKPSK